MDTEMAQVAQKPTPRKTGRPSTFTPEIGHEICHRLAQGETLRSICRDDHLPLDLTVREWAWKDPTFASQYVQARDRGLDRMADELLDISDDGSNDWMERETKRGTIETVVDREAIERSRLRVDTRKWYLAKLAPKRYSERVELTSADGQALFPTGGDISQQLIEMARGMALVLVQATQAQEQSGQLIEGESVPAEPTEPVDKSA
jgi:hypothetical protein